VSVGASRERIDAPGKVTGDSQYPADIAHDGLHARVLFSDQPHARMVSIDLTAAREVPGVVEIFTAADVPVNEYGLTMFDQPVFVGVGASGRSNVPSDVSRWEADQVALVVAETTEAADRGAAAIAIEWEALTLVPDLDAALDGSTLVHPENGLDSNIFVHKKIRKGDVAAAWDRADVVIEGTYELPYQEHAYLQPEAAVSYLDDAERITVEIAGQWTHEDQEQIAHALDLPLERIRVIYPAIGGAFGGREDMTLQIVMALATWRLSERGETRPIRTIWSREESIVGHHKRHRGRIHTRWGATSEGELIVVEADGYLDAGAYNYTTNKVLGNLHLCVAGPYRVPNARIDSMGVYTNAVPGGAFRGFGAPQGAFAAESQMNKLAAALGMDPVALRLKNTLREGSIGITMVEMPAGVSLPIVIEECATAAGWDAPVAVEEAPDFRPFQTLSAASDAIRVGRGFACCYKNVGFSFGFPENSTARIELEGDSEVELVRLFYAGADVGQGGHTAWMQMAAEATGVDVEKVQAEFSDTASSGDSGSASASRLTWMTGNAILGAAEEAGKAWIDGERPAIGDFKFIPPPTETLDPETGYGQPNFAYGYVAEAVEIAVDIETGHIEVRDVTCAVDVGKAINPNLVEGQIEGAVVQAHGYVLTENLQVREGRILNPRLSTYLIPGIMDIPLRVKNVIVEEPDPRGPWGARGMAEMPFIPFAPAVVAALHDATGVWFDTFPLTPPRVRAALVAAGVVS
jgi:CO/xanthine dehydrogenase Mo-binding subunit